MHRHKGSKQDAGNYRPVSLTSVPGKIMESLIKEHVEYLNDKHWLSVSQHGFVKGRSCLTNLLEAFEARTRLLDEGHRPIMLPLNGRSRAHNLFRQFF